jgi:hypothetical protein
VAIAQLLVGFSADFGADIKVAIPFRCSPWSPTRPADAHGGREQSPRSDEFSFEVGPR